VVFGSHEHSGQKGVSAFLAFLRRIWWSAATPFNPFAAGVGEVFVGVIEGN
jgi:hypothetical protein